MGKFLAATTIGAAAAGDHKLTGVHSSSRAALRNGNAMAGEAGARAQLAGGRRLMAVERTGWWGMGELVEERQDEGGVEVDRCSTTVFR